MMKRYSQFDRPKSLRTFDVQKELDEVVGRYEERPGERLAVRLLRILARGLLGAAAAIAVAFAVMYVLHKHVGDAQRAPAKVVPGKPVPIDLIPAK
jgi:hypothetical protein